MHFHLIVLENVHMYTRVTAHERMAVAGARAVLEHRCTYTQFLHACLQQIRTQYTITVQSM